jgi:hypothetical protein
MSLRIFLTMALMVSSIINVEFTTGEADLSLGNARLLNLNLNANARGQVVTDGVVLGGGAYAVDSLSGAAAAGLMRGVSTQNYQLAPKYLTEKEVRKPKVITETVVQPIYEKTINRPTLHRERLEAEPNLIQSETQVRNSSRTLPVANTSATVTKVVNVPGNTRFIQPVVQPTLLVRTETVDVRPSPAQERRNPDQILPTRQTAEVRTRDVNVPGATIHNRTFVQPILTTENVGLAVQRAPTKRIDHAPITAPVVVQNRLINQRVVVPARQIFNQRIIQPQHTLERVKLNLIQTPPTSETREAIIKPTLRRRNVQKQYHNVVYRVPVAREVQVVKPFYVRVNDLRTEYVPVDEQGNALSADAAASVLGNDGFAFTNDAGSLNYADLQGQGVNIGNLELAQAQEAQADAQADDQDDDLVAVNAGNWSNGAYLIGDRN